MQEGKEKSTLINGHTPVSNLSHEVGQFPEVKTQVSNPSQNA